MSTIISDLLHASRESSDEEIIRDFVKMDSLVKYNCQNIKDISDYFQIDTMTAINELSHGGLKIRVIKAIGRERFNSSKFSSKINDLYNYKWIIDTMMKNINKIIFLYKKHTGNIIMKDEDLFVSKQDERRECMVELFKNGLNFSPCYIILGGR